MSLSTSKLASSKEYREAFVSSFLKRYIPFQIRAIRKKRGMSQPELAEASKITQGVISRAENPDYGNLTFNTVLRIAAGFDVAFVGRFVRFSEFLEVVDEMSEKSCDLPSFLEESKSGRIPTPKHRKLRIRSRTRRRHQVPTQKISRKLPRPANRLELGQMAVGGGIKQPWVPGAHAPIPAGNNDATLAICISGNSIRH